MSGDAQYQVRRMLYTVLTAALSPAKVFDHVPQNTAFPYAVIGDGQSEEFDTDTEHGQEHRVEIHFFTRDPKRGRKAVMELQKLAYDALHDQSQTLEAGAAMVFCYFVNSQAYPDPDGKTWHGISTFRIVTTEA